ncbi:hypothetical protein FM104_12755 [Microbacterium esteraromaticum]|uniref:Uncharacterized protein n=1 Tax=Microbacterium esteraromaticum TaxID=57043 RepID=A0A1R4KH49_9MICO|nr:hypothetical protein [Microbacterium esteraromaticum]SJN43588.1 hypothetical protein FM104_12755 [Microbacterium esteraromaticum]
MTITTRVPRGVSSHGGEFTAHHRTEADGTLAPAPPTPLETFRDASPKKQASMMVDALDRFDALTPLQKMEEWRLAGDSKLAVVFTAHSPEDCARCGGYWFRERDDEQPYCPQCAGMIEG